MIATIDALTAAREAAIAAQKKIAIRVLVCAGTGCVANGSLEVLAKFEELLGKDQVAFVKEPAGPCQVDHTGCHGFCERGPLVKIDGLDILYTRVRPEDVAEIVDVTIKHGQVIDRLLYTNPNTGEKSRGEHDIPFYARQKRTSLANCGNINPDNVNDYIARKGYTGLAKVLESMTPEEVCQEMSESGLRGRGGGGFPTGRKWEFVRRAKGDKKYVIVNGDEGDPGAFMDRSVMEGDPHAVLEGMAIAAYAVGADEGVIYVRAEYPLAVARVRTAIKQATEQGLLGENILGTDFNFKVRVKEGAGAFVCGEETALIASVEGQRGMPRSKPPFPANSGLFGKPTLINNVETFANVPLIIRNGAEWFASMGTATSKGTKTFALTGEVVNTGLIEVPMGTTLREVIFDIGGGVRNGKKFKAVQIGGPSGGCLTEEHLDISLDYDSLIAAGAMVGSGGLVVMNEDTCIVEVARFFMHFTQSESCGKCTLCREGTRRMLQTLEKIVAGLGKEEDLETLAELAVAVKDGSLCGLGKTAPNPVLSTFKYFMDEYKAHVIDGRCPAKVCQAFKHYEIDPAICKGCSKCSRICPASAISGKVKSPFTIDPETCVRCGACVASCPFNAIKEVV
ncbi:MAG TPA: NADH-quinone oxidoreductase subunit NuoF [Armatimonadota bacterium]|nr:NADH-quinone oxidoreductase subunit NuoF [Armatimonadota bacterium]